mmetsp:Transcript_31620/g.38409  ORF Transcript_31620/g.38409 Transcript_31620/m.38409 type:complete len:98 (+) Transcript_31620:1104-1397(+)
MYLMIKNVAHEVFFVSHIVTFQVMFQVGICVVITVLEIYDFSLLYSVKLAKKLLQTLNHLINVFLDEFSLKGPRDAELLDFPKFFWVPLFGFPVIIT